MREIRPVDAELLTTCFDAADAASAPEDTRAFYEWFYSALDDDERG